MGLSMFEKKYTDGFYTQDNPTFNDNESSIKAQSLLRLLNDTKIDLNKIKSILDVGCGGGGLLASLNKIHSEKIVLHGIDLNPDAIDFAKNRSKTELNMQFSNSDVSTVTGDYDLSMAVHVVEHVPDIHDFIKNLCRISGLVYIVIPIEASVWSTIRKGVLAHQYERYGHIHFFNEPVFDKMLCDFGFEIIGRGYSDEFKAFDTVSAKIIKYPRMLLGYISKKFACNFLGGYCYQVLIRSK